MIALTVEPDGFSESITGLRRVAGELPDRLEQAVEALTVQLDDALHATAPVSQASEGGETPGRLRDSIRYDLDGTHSLFFASEIAWYVIGGTRPHLIQGNPLLHFYWDKAGGWVTFAHVNHPGTKPNDFRIEALDLAAAAAETELDAIGDWIAEAIGG